MKFSYSNVSAFESCPYKWKLHYIDHLKTIPPTNADNPLWLGLGLHKGIEDWSVESGVAEYRSHFNVLTDAQINWTMQLEYQLREVFKQLPPDGEHELKVDTPEFIGYIDYVCGDTLYDFKFSNNTDRYRESPQLSIYKYFYEATHPGAQINHLKFMVVPKCMIRQKKDETIMEFRNRLVEALTFTRIKFLEVPYRPEAVSEYLANCRIISECKEFPKKESPLCNWCDYKAFCQSDGEIDWMIV